MKNRIRRYYNRESKLKDDKAIYCLSLISINNEIERVRDDNYGWYLSELERLRQIIYDKKYVINKELEELSGKIGIK